MEPFDVLRDRLPGWSITFAPFDDVMGYTVVDERRIYVSSLLDGRQRRSTLVHEIFHALRGDCDDDPAVEREVSRLTAVELVPLVALVGALSLSANMADLLDSLDVDHGVLRRRIRDLTDDEASAVRRVLAVHVPGDDSGLCAIGRWWRRNQQPEPLPCADCSGVVTVPARNIDPSSLASMVDGVFSGALG